MINTKAQMLFTLSLPTMIYAFYRIKKLRLGILIHILGSLLASSSLVNLITLTSLAQFGVYFIASCFIFGFSFILPMIYIRKWTISFNNKLLEPLKDTKP